jgi:hypothetical protein
MKDTFLHTIAQIIQEDVGGRGLRTDPASNLITATANDFRAACLSVANTAGASVAIVTGFYIPHAEPPCGETDGPLGALFLARALSPLGIKVTLATDGFCTRALEVGLAACGLTESVKLIMLPAARIHDAEYWRNFTAQTGPLTHLVALERVGPSHTLHSLQAQLGREGALGESYLEFLHEVPAEQQDRCHTMRGRDITDFMSPAHLLFEAAAQASPRITTIGIGDGGNEIGMGKIPWDIIRRNIPGGGLVACRVPTDFLIVCGISNWGAYGLATGVCLLRGQPGEAGLYDRPAEARLLRAMVEQGPLVDGVSGKPTVTVDGLPFDRYSDPLRRLAAI